MAYEIILGRTEEEKAKYGLQGTVLLGKHYVRMGQVTALSSPVYLDVAKSHVVLVAGKRGGGKSYTLGVIAEGISDLPPEIKQNTSIILLDTMGIYWTMKYPNNKDAAMLREWGMEGKPLDIKIFTPSGFFKEFREKGIPTDFAFSLRPGELEPEDWFLTFEIAATEPLAVFIEKTILKLKEEKGTDYDIDDVIAAVKLDLEEETHIIGAAINRFEAVKRWGVFSKQGTEMKDIAKPGQVSVLDLSCYAAMAEGWRIKNLVIGIVSEKLFMDRMAARREEEFKSIQSAIHYFEEETTTERMPLVWLVIDEAHEFLPYTGKTAATDALVTILREGRQPGISLVLATQQPGKIHSDVMTQSDIIISHRVTAKVDIEALQSLLATYMRTGIEKEMDLLPRVAGAGIAVDDVNERMYPLRIRPRFTWHGGAAPIAIPEKKTIFEFK